MMDFRDKEVIWSITYCTEEYLVDVMEETVQCLKFEILMKL